MKDYINLISNILLAILASAVTWDTIRMIDEFPVAFSFRLFVVYPTLLVCSLVFSIVIWRDAWKSFKEVRQ